MFEFIIIQFTYVYFSEFCYFLQEGTHIKELKIIKKIVEKNYSHANINDNQLSTLRLNEY